MSPNLSGIDVVDQARSIRLAEVALDFARTHLQPGGDLVVKVFQGAGLEQFQRAVRADFNKVYLRKPKASRDRSREHYVVAKGVSRPVRLSLSGDNGPNPAKRVNSTRLSECARRLRRRFNVEWQVAPRSRARAGQ